MPASNEGVPLGCLVTALTLSHVLPVGSITRGEVATKRGMGMYTTRLFYGTLRDRGDDEDSIHVCMYVCMYAVNIRGGSEGVREL